jgi:DNA polymerase-3 subunit alpha
MGNYTIYHLHTMLSNGVTNIDSVTKFNEYVSKAKECGMTSLAFSEHGNVFEWLHKKEAVEKAGMKYIHAIEAYITEKPFWENEEGKPERKRDNYHCVLVAKNYEGVRELNRLASKAFNKEDGHFYYTPRIFFEELLNTSDNIITTTACIGGTLSKGNEELKQRYIEFLKNNSHRCFLEIQHHNTESQKEYNKYLYNLSRETGIRLIAGTDTHCLNDLHAEARVVLQRGKNTYFDGEEGWDLTFKSYEELVNAYKVQNVLPEDVFLDAIENTNILANMVESFEIDRSLKYPKISGDASKTLHDEIFGNQKAIDGIITEGYDKEVVMSRLQEEYSTADSVDACAYFLLQKHITDWCHENDIWTGPGRGSAASSMILYLFGVTDINPLKHNFQFWRFMHKDKYSLADVDLDYSEKDRDRLLYFMLHDKLNLNNIQTSHIITFNTIALKGAIKDIGRGLGMSIEETSEISNAVYEKSEDENKVTIIDDVWRKKYPKLFKYVDAVIGTIVSIGSHPSGVLVTDRNIDEEIGICYLSGNEYPVSCLNMKELDSLNFVKFDCLG